MTNIVQVQFKSRYRDEFCGNAYTYIADVPLLVGDIVKVPTKFGDSEARVCRIDVPESEIPAWCGELRHITEPASPSGTIFDDFFI